jgi:hypothetical protein
MHRIFCSAVAQSTQHRIAFSSLRIRDCGCAWCYCRFAGKRSHILRVGAYVGIRR